MDEVTPSVSTDTPSVPSTLLVTLAEEGRYAMHQAVRMTPCRHPPDKRQGRRTFTVEVGEHTLARFLSLSFQSTHISLTTSDIFQEQSTTAVYLG